MTPRETLLARLDAAIKSGVTIDLPEPLADVPEMTAEELAAFLAKCFPDAPSGWDRRAGTPIAYYFGPDGEKVVATQRELTVAEQLEDALFRLRVRERQWQESLRRVRKMRAALASLGVTDSAVLGGEVVAVPIADGAYAASLTAEEPFRRPTADTPHVVVG